MRHPNFDVIKLAEALSGTCDALYSTLNKMFEMDEDDMTQEDCNTLDGEVFCCTMCGWWWDQPAEESKESGEWICADCKSDEENE